VEKCCGESRSSSTAGGWRRGEADAGGQGGDTEADEETAHQKNATLIIFRHHQDTLSKKPYRRASRKARKSASPRSRSLDVFSQRLDDLRSVSQFRRQDRADILITPPRNAARRAVFLRWV
jgi:hypothetical protein